MITIVFYPRGQHQTIQVSVNHKGQQYRKSTGYNLNSLKWDKDRQKIKGRTDYADKVNRFLRQLEEAVEVATSYRKAKQAVGMILNKKDSDQSEYEDATLLAFMTHHREEVVSRHKKSTRACYDSVIKHYSIFVKDHGDLDPLQYDFNSVPVSDRRHLIKEFKGHFHSFISYLVEHGVKPSSQKMYLAKIRAAINWIKDDYGIELPNKMPSPKVVRTSIALPIDAIKQFMQLDERYHDPITMSVYLLCKIQLCTALRLEDAASMRMKDIIKYKDIPYVININQKTGKKTLSRIHPNVYREILAKGFGDNIYADKFIRIGRTQRNEYTNERMKQIWSVIDAMHEYAPVVEQQPNGTWETKQVKYIEMLHNHMLRKGAITFLSYAGAMEKHIKKSSGHSADSEAYAKIYDLVVDTELERDLGRAQDLFYNM